MEIAHVAQVPTQSVDIVEPVNDKLNEHKTEVSLTESVGNNHAESLNTAESVKLLESELVLDPPTEEKLSDNVTAASSTSNGGDACLSEAPVSPRSSRLSEGGAEVVTPAGTVEAPAGASDTPSTETMEKEAEAPVMNANDTETEAYVVDHEVQHETINPISAQDTTATMSTESVPSPTKKAKIEKKQANHDSFVSEEVLSQVQTFFTLQIVENHCCSHTKEIHEFVEAHFNETQRRRYIAPLIERIVHNFTQEATAKGEEVSLDIQSNICLVEQMFLTLGRRSPLEDMYTAEEEEMLDLLFHSNSNNNLPIDT